MRFEPRIDVLEVRVDGRRPRRRPARRRRSTTGSGRRTPSTTSSTRSTCWRGGRSDARARPRSSNPAAPTRCWRCCARASPPTCRAGSRSPAPARRCSSLYAQMLAALAQRIDRAPDKNELAFLDLLGLELLAAQPARAPLVLTAVAGARRRPRPGRRAVRRHASRGGDADRLRDRGGDRARAARIAELRSCGRAATRAPTSAADLGAGASADPVDRPGGARPRALSRPRALPGAGGPGPRRDRCGALATSGSAPLAIDWTYWDGELWRDDRAAPTPATTARRA